MGRICLGCGLVVAISVCETMCYYRLLCCVEWVSLGWGWGAQSNKCLVVFMNLEFTLAHNIINISNYYLSFFLALFFSLVYFML